MKQRLMLWAAGVALLAAVVLPLAFHAQPAPLQPGAPPATARAAAATPAPQPQPRLNDAIRHLEAARDLLKEIPGDFRGHRKEALVYVDKALWECGKMREEKER